MTITYQRMRLLLDRKRATSKDETLARIGEALLQCQQVEQSLRFVTTFVIQKPRDGGLDLAAYEAQTVAERKSTIGYFLSQLRLRVDVEPTMDAVFSRFLERRNVLAHHLEAVAGWSLSDEPGLTAANNFLTDMLTDATFIYFWLGGLMKSWQKQVGIETEFDDNHPAELIIDQFAELAEWSLGEKGSLQE